MAGHRREASWSALSNEQLSGILTGLSATEEQIRLPPPTEGEELVADYRSLGLTLGRHPLALLRDRLMRLRVRLAADFAQLRNGQKVRVAGVVTHRQRPERASGVVFTSLEDETGISNVIV